MSVKNYPCLSIESVHGHTSNTASILPISFPLQSLSVSDETWANSWPLVIPVCAGHEEVNFPIRDGVRLHSHGYVQAYPARGHPALHSTIQAVDGVAETSHPEILIADIHDQGSPIIAYSHPPAIKSETDSICQRVFSRFTPVWGLVEFTLILRSDRMSRPYNQCI